MTATGVTTPTTTKPESQALQCMDIWGGTEAVDRSFSVPGLDVHIVSAPYQGDLQGGDIYYISMCGSGRVARLAVADVSGHGEAVAQVSTGLRKLMRKYINTPDQARFARSLNEKFLADSRDGTFATAVLATYWAPTDHLILVNAGHPPPLLYRYAEQKWHTVTHSAAGVQAASDDEIGVRNLPLGIIEPTGYDQFAIKLEPDDVVVLYTDALPEASDANNRLLGTEGLLDLCEQADGSEPMDLADRILAAVDSYRAGSSADDDQTVMVLHHNAAEPPPMGVGDYLRFLGRMVGVVGPSTATH